MNRKISYKVVKALHDQYRAGASLYSLANANARTSSAIRELFQSRGLKLRTAPKHLRNRPQAEVGSQWLPQYPDLTWKEVKEYVAQLTRPRRVYRWQWDRWNDDEKRRYLKLLRFRFAIACAPAAPYSANVEPFDYFHAKARALSTRKSRCGIKLLSQGVIWRGQLFFWQRFDSHYYPGQWSPVHGKVGLHTRIWEDHHGRRVPDDHTVIHIDGNKNNLMPENLAMRSRSEAAAIMCQTRWKQKEALARDEITAALAEFNQSKKAK